MIASPTTPVSRPVACQLATLGSPNRHPHRSSRRSQDQRLPPPKAGRGGAAALPRAVEQEAPTAAWSSVLDPAPGEWTFPLSKEELVALTKEYLSLGLVAGDKLRSDDFVLRGPAVGPLNKKDYMATFKTFGLGRAYPDAERIQYNIYADPYEPGRVWYMSRLKGTHTEDLDMFGNIFPATGNSIDSPPESYSLVWNEEGKIRYHSVGYIIDRFAGNTKGLGGIFGMLVRAGIPAGALSNKWLLNLQQKIGPMLGRPKSFSSPEDLPDWWQYKDVTGPMDIP